MNDFLKAEEKLQYYNWICDGLKSLIDTKMLTDHEVNEFSNYIKTLSNNNIPTEEKHYTAILAEQRLTVYCDILGIPLSKRNRGRK